MANEQAVQAIMKAAQKAGVKADTDPRVFADRVSVVRSRVAALREDVAQLTAETKIFPREQSALIKARQTLELAIQQLNEAEYKLQQQAKLQQAKFNRGE